MLEITIVLMEQSTDWYRQSELCAPCGSSRRRIWALPPPATLAVHLAAFAREDMETQLTTNEENAGDPQNISKTVKTYRLRHVDKGFDRFIRHFQPERPVAATSCVEEASTGRRDRQLICNREITRE
jgi:hypothetical protein